MCSRIVVFDNSISEIGEDLKKYFKNTYDYPN